MGKILTIRVMAQTFDEDEVIGAWPGLCALVWPQWALQRSAKALGVTAAPRPDFDVTAIERSLGQQKHGVVELAAAVTDYAQFADFSSLTAAGQPWARQWSAFLEGVADVTKAQKNLETALGDWDVQRAVTATNTLEACLEQAESVLPS